MEYYSAIKSSYAATWMELQGIMLSEISQIKTNTMWFHLYTESKRQNKWINRKSYRHREQTGGCQRGRGWVGREVAEGN